MTAAQGARGVVRPAAGGRQHMACAPRTMHSPQLRLPRTSTSSACAELATKRLSAPRPLRMTLPGSWTARPHLRKRDHGHRTGLSGTTQPRMLHRCPPELSTTAGLLALARAACAHSRNPQTAEQESCTEDLKISIKDKVLTGYTGALITGWLLEPGVPRAPKLPNRRTLH